jgi:hypothetical protein
VGSIVRRPTVLSVSEAALRPARWRASSCLHKLGGALKTSHPPPRPRPSAPPCWPIRRRSWSREHRARELWRAHARSVRAARARLRQQRRLEVDESRKRDAQRGPPAGPSRAPATLALFLGVGFPVVNWGSMGDMERKVNGKCAYFTYFKVRGSRV